MKFLDISPGLQEKIYDVKYSEDGILQITSYFPLKGMETQEIAKAAKNHSNQVRFKSVFSDEIPDDEWEKNKQQIKMKFQDELFNID